MRHIAEISMMALILALGAGAGAATAADMKIGTVKIQTIINDSAAGREALNKLKVMMEDEGRRLQDKQKELKRLESEYDQQKLVSRPEVLEEKEFEIIKMRRDLESYRNDSSTLLRRAQAKASQGIINDVQKIIQEYAAKNGISIVLENSAGVSAQGGVVAFADESIDITAAVIKIYDEKVKGSKPAGAGR